MVEANGAGLAANQVYEPVQICAIWVKDNPRYPYKPNVPLTILVNPTIELLTDDTFVNYEGCLSVPNLRGEVKRVTHIRVRAWDREGNAIDREAKGLTAGTYQHEADHVDASDAHVPQSDGAAPPPEDASRDAPFDSNGQYDGAAPPPEDAGNDAPFDSSGLSDGAAPPPEDAGDGG